MCLRIFKTFISRTPTYTHNTQQTQELNARGSHLLFRDKSRRLFLFDIAAQEHAPLLPFASYAQWVPGSDAVVAQARGELCVWYGINAPDRWVCGLLQCLLMTACRR